MGNGDSQVYNMLCGVWAQMKNKMSTTICYLGFGVDLIAELADATRSVNDSIQFCPL